VLALIGFGLFLKPAIVGFGNNPEAAREQASPPPQPAKKAAAELIHTPSLRLSALA
jgi:hypothetical protein